MNIRWASVRDARQLAKVHVDSWRAAYRGMVPDSALRDFTVDRWEKHFRKAIADKTEEIAVAEEDGVILGYTIIGPSRDEDFGAQGSGEIWGLYVSPEHCGRGVGRGLTEWACGELRSRGYEFVTLWVFETNEAARKFYEANGFIPDGATRQIRTDATPAIRYRKPISGS